MNGETPSSGQTNSCGFDKLNDELFKKIMCYVEDVCSDGGCSKTVNRQCLDYALVARRWTSYWSYSLVEIGNALMDGAQPMRCKQGICLFPFITDS